MKIKFILAIFLLLSAIVGCAEKDSLSIVNDDFYIVDSYQILMLCESDEADIKYIELLPQLKGNGGEVKATIESLSVLRDSIETKNALGVAYIRLREYDKALEVLEIALEDVQTEEQRVCIFTNLAAVKSLNGFHEEAYELLLLAEQSEVNSPVKQLVLESNLHRANVQQKKSAVQEIAAVKQLLKKEQQLLGQNQFIGIYNYVTLGLACFEDDQYKKSKEYMNIAIELNDDLYQYKFVTAELNRMLAEINMNYKDDVDAAFICINKSIEILENWEEKEHPELINMYLSRSRMYYSINQEENALRDIQVALSRSKPMHDLAAVSYFNIGWIHYEKYRDALAIDNLAKAY